MITSKISLYPPFRREEGYSPLYRREKFPLIEKEGLVEIFATICLFDYWLLSNPTHFQLTLYPHPKDRGRSCKKLKTRIRIFRTTASTKSSHRGHANR
jgi:hypothetical protein